MADPVLFDPDDVEIADLIAFLLNRTKPDRL
jgi:hypothetical protein